MANKENSLVNRKNPNRAIKKELQKEAIKKMNGRTRRERIANFFTNRTGYYAWKEMLVNYLLIIFAVMALAAGIFCLCNIKHMSIATLLTDLGFTCVSIGLGGFIIIGIIKIRYRKQRFKCYMNNGISNRYVFWKDDKTNPKNKESHRSFE